MAGRARGATLPDSHLTGLGRDTGGATPAEVVDRVIGAVGEGADKAVASLGLGKMLDAAKERAAGAYLGPAFGRYEIVAELVAEAR